MKKTQTSTSSNGHRGLFRWMTAGVAALLLSVTSVYAQQTGTVAGQVVDTSTGKYLEGAEVSINDLRASTERDGKFTLRNVPEGTQKLVVNYPGLDSSETDVVVKAGESVQADVKLAAQEVITLGEFKVEGTKEGMSQAIALQKVAIQGKLVTAGDQFGSISEGNVGEYLKYLPGVGVDYNVNDARGVSLRGLRTSFTIVAVDGTPMASASSGAANRRFELEQVTSTNVETTEVYKMLLPDAPADATGGYINMVTKSAFDRQDIQRFSYDVSFITPSSRISDSFSKQSGTWGKDSQYIMRPNLDLNFARRVNDKVGFNLSYKLSERYDDSPRTEYTWVTASAGVTGTSTGTPLSVQDATLLTYRQANEQKLTHRESFGAKVDYFITDATKLTFSGQWNWYDLTFTQRAHAYTFGTTGINNAPGIDENRSAASGANIADTSSQRRKYGTTIHTNATLSHDFNDSSKAWMTAYWSQADSKYRDHTDGFFAEAQARLNSASNFTIYDVSKSQKNPGVAVVGRTYDQLFDLSNYTLQTANTARLRPNTAQDTKSGVQAHYKYTFDSSIPLSVQTGAAYDLVGRNIDERAYSITGASALTGSALEALGSNYLFDFGYNYGTGEVLDLYKLYDAYGAATIASRPTTWNVTRFDENNLGAYIRADATFLKTLTVAGGFRYEMHELESYRFSAITTASRPTPVNMDYAKLYPSLMVKYQPNRNWVARAGVSRTVGHPDYAEVLPNFTYAEGATSGNFTFPDPDLKPYNVTNFDVSLEYYFSKSGLASASVFRKDVDGFITSGALSATEGLEKLKVYDPNVTAADLGSAPRYTTWQNGKNSSVQGIELMYNQTLTFLPKPFDGLNVQINWSKMDVDADDLATQYAQELAANLQTFNFSIGYRYGKFSTNISTNWTDDKLVSTNLSNNTLNSYQAPDWKTTIGVRYEISKRYQVYVNVANLFSKRTEYYKGSGLDAQSVELPFRSFEFGYPHISLGVKGTF